jgi:hypothetical protein
MAGVIYLNARVLFATDADWASPTQKFKVLLATSDYQPKASHRHVTDVTGELTGKGYKRKLVRNRSVRANEARNVADCCAAAIKLEGLATKESYQWLVVYREGPDDLRSDLICAVDMGHVPLTDVGTHEIRWDGAENEGRVFSLQ